jgi:L-ascorbate metabolism protein UlaG (beta-lactamase superfamily)
MLLHRIRGPVALSALALAAVTACGAPAERPSHAATHRLGKSTLTWIGGPTAVVRYGELQFITDPMLGPRGPDAFTLPKHPSSGKPNASFTRYLSPAPVALDALDAILVSHTHNDHVDARAKELLPKDVPLVVAAAGAAAMRAAGFTDVRPIDWGESVTLKKGSVELAVHAVPAHHSHDVEIDREVGKGNGYILELRDPSGHYVIYWTGDSVLSEEMRTVVSKLGPIDLMLPHMGGVGGDGDRGLRTMDAEEAMALFNWVSPRFVIPIHHTTFSHYREPIEALTERASEAGLSERFLIPREGVALPLPQPHR